MLNQIDRPYNLIKHFKNSYNLMQRNYLIKVFPQSVFQNLPKEIVSKMLPMLRCRLINNLHRAFYRSYVSEAAKASSADSPPKDIPVNGISDGHKEKPPSMSYTEVEVPVPWGHISGKWWGTEDRVPVIGLHGFEDNAGTYDRLAPLLEIPAFFAWDAPGHGRSSHMPEGHTYHFIDFLISLRLLVRRFGWEKISLIGHSWGSVLALMYSAIYPNSVERYVSIDCARTLMPNVGVLGISRIRKIINHMVKCDSYGARGLTPPSYSIRDVRGLIVQGTYESITHENCDPLIERGTLTHPLVPDSLYFSRDHRLRVGDACRPTNEMTTLAAGQIRCHFMSIVARQGFVYMVGDAVKRHYRHQESIIQQSAASYKAHLVKGTHHVHLNNPERVAPLINDFFQ